MTDLDYSTLKEPVDIGSRIAELGIGRGKASGSGVNGSSKAVLKSFTLFAVISLLIILLFAISNNNFGLIQMFALLLFAVTMMMALLLSRAGDAVKLKRFAEKNSGSFFSGLVGAEFDNVILKRGHSHSFIGLVSLKGRIIDQIASLEFTVGSGKNKQTVYYGYVRVNLPRRLPHIIIDAKKNNELLGISNLTHTLDRSLRLKLEGNFSDHFDVYVPPSYEKDALYILTPDVMHSILDHSKGYDIEIIDDKLYIYKPGKLKLKDEEMIKNLVDVANVISGEVGKQANLYVDNSVGDRSLNLISTQGSRLKMRTSWWAYLITILIFAYIIFNLLSSFLFR